MAKEKTTAPSAKEENQSLVANQTTEEEIIKLQENWEQSEKDKKELADQLEQEKLAKQKLQENWEQSEKDKKELQEELTALKEKQPNPKAKKETSTSNLVYTDASGAAFTFTPKAPAKFNFHGKNKTQEEWIKDAQAMESLILGKSPYVKPIKN